MRGIGLNIQAILGSLLIRSKADLRADRMAVAGGLTVPNSFGKVEELR